jgi:hypothetical protein
VIVQLQSQAQLQLSFECNYCHLYHWCSDIVLTRRSDTVSESALLGTISLLFLVMWLLGDDLGLRENENTSNQVDIKVSF